VASFRLHLHRELAFTILSGCSVPREPEPLEAAHRTVAWAVSIFLLPIRSLLSASSLFSRRPRYADERYVPYLCNSILPTAWTTVAILTDRVWSTTPTPLTS
jgi:hypothetical protein